MTKKEHTRDLYLRRTYGISLVDYLALWVAQGSKCPVCLRKMGAFKGNPHVDHDHVTGEIRGLLCGNCNHRVVGRHRDSDLLERAGLYLKGPFTGLIVPKKKRRKRSRKTKR